MKITTKSRYGVRALIDIAQHQERGPVMMEAIAKRQCLSRKYLHALLTKLRRAGIVRSVRGAGGGYLLSKAPKEITLDALLLVLEGRVCELDCVEAHETCERSSSCSTRSLWQGIARTMTEYLQSISLADILREEGAFDDGPCIGETAAQAHDSPEQGSQ